MAHSRFASPSATRAVLERYGLYTRKSLGQHFLVDDNIVGRIVGLAALDGSEPVLEVGPGIGTLTDALCTHAGHVVAVERDPRLEPVLTDLAGEVGDLTVLYADAVTIPIDQLTTPLGSPVALVANLPYGVAATVVLRLFEELSSLRFAVIMVQAEVADRMVSTPGTKDYGSYSVKLQLLVQPAGRFAVPRQCFLPPPRVDSSVVRLERRVDAVAPDVAHAAARAAGAAFSQRRKTVRNSLKATLGIPAAQLDEALEESGIDGGVRAETIPVDGFVRLGAILKKNGLLP